LFGEENQSVKMPCVLDHIAIAVEDLDKAIETYTKGFGLSVVDRRCTTGNSTGMVSAVLIGAGVPIVLLQGTDPDSQVTRFVRERGAGVQHLAFAVSDIDAGIDQFAQLGSRPAFPPVIGEGIRQVFLEKDGSGPRVELIERQGGDFNDDSVRALFLAMEERELL